jgi:hypothetical protein
MTRATSVEPVREFWSSKSDIMKRRRRMGGLWAYRTVNLHGDVGSGLELGCLDRSADLDGLRGGSTEERSGKEDGLELHDQEGS